MAHSMTPDEKAALVAQIRDVGGKTALEAWYSRTLGLQVADLVGANLEGVDLSGAKIRRVNLVDANLDRARLENAVFDRVQVSFSRFRFANLQGALFWKSHFLACDFCYADFTDAKIREGTEFVGGHFYCTKGLSNETQRKIIRSLKESWGRK